MASPSAADACFVIGVFDNVNPGGVTKAWEDAAAREAITNKKPVARRDDLVDADMICFSEAAVNDVTPIHSNM
jgi:hypothetical protein